jgi:hypothetical protein
MCALRIHCAWRFVFVALELKRGKYLLDGVQNQDHTRHKGSVYTNVPGYSPGPAEAPMHWRHAIAIKDGKVYEQNADVFSIQYLWLKDDNRPDINNGSNAAFVLCSSKYRRTGVHCGFEILEPGRTPARHRSLKHRS